MSMDAIALMGMLAARYAGESVWFQLDWSRRWPVVATGRAALQIAG